MHLAGDLYVFDLANLGAGHCVLPGVCDLFLCGAISTLEPRVVSATASGTSFG
jgi:hypothetical protein